MEELEDDECGAEKEEVVKWAMANLFAGAADTVGVLIICLCTATDRGMNQDRINSMDLLPRSLSPP
jgi:hypothetical protein